MNVKNLRKLHRKIAPFVFLPLFVTALTGVSYRVARSWFGVSEEVGDMIMFIHQGTFLGKDLRVFYVILNGLGLLGMVVSGIVMSSIFFSSRKNKNATPK